MPIYAYRCSTCHHTQEFLQKINDAPLHICPACGKSTLVKQVTAAGFQLKGSGWYATDFRGNNKTNTESSSAPEQKPSESNQSSTTTSVNSTQNSSGSQATSPTNPSQST